MKRMIRYSIPLLLFLIINNLTAQNTKNSKKVLLLHTIYQWQDTTWKFHRLESLHYNDKEQHILSQFYVFTNNQLELSGETYLEYYDFDSVKKISGDNGLSLFYYNELHLLSEKSITIYYPLTFTNYYNYYYNTDKKLIEVFTMDGIDTISKNNYQYNDDGTISEIFEYKKEDSIWSSVSYIHFDYDENKYITGKYYYIREDDQWTNYSKYIYQYYNNYSESESIFAIWDDTAWLNHNRTHKWFDSDGFLLKDMYWT